MTGRVKALEPWAVERPRLRINGMIRVHRRWGKLEDLPRTPGNIAMVKQILSERRSVAYRLPPANRWSCRIFFDLPEVHQKAVRHYMEHHGCRADYANMLFWTGDMDVADLQYGVMHDIARSQGYRNFPHYHSWFMENVIRDTKRGVPKGSTEVWPVILSTFEDEGLQDGSHRFHRYVEQGLEAIPVLAFVTELQGIEVAAEEWMRQG